MAARSVRGCGEGFTGGELHSATPRAVAFVQPRLLGEKRRSRSRPLRFSTVMMKTRQADGPLGAEWFTFLPAVSCLRLDRFL